MDLHLESSRISTAIWPGSKYPSDERNKLFSFQIKATLKATTLGIRMYSAELLLWKDQKDLTC